MTNCPLRGTIGRPPGLSSLANCSSCEESTSTSAATSAPALDEQPRDQPAEGVGDEEQRAVDAALVEQALELVREPPRVARAGRRIAPAVARAIVRADPRPRRDGVGDRRPFERAAAEPALEHHRHARVPGRALGVVRTAAAMQVQPRVADPDPLPGRLVEKGERQRLLGGANGTDDERARRRRRDEHDEREHRAACAFLTRAAQGRHPVPGARRGPHAPGSRYESSLSTSLSVSSSATGRSHSARRARSRWS